MPDSSFALIQLTVSLVQGAYTLSAYGAQGTPGGLPDFQHQGASASPGETEYLTKVTQAIVKAFGVQGSVQLPPVPDASQIEALPARASEMLKSVQALDGPMTKTQRRAMERAARHVGKISAALDRHLNS